jgi:hypothetical protein
MMKLLLTFLLLCCVNASAAPTGSAVAIHRDIDKLVSIYNDGFDRSKTKPRHLAFGALFGAASDTDRQDAVAFFALSGVDLTNVHQEYIAIFVQGQGRDLSEHEGPKERPYHLIATSMVGSRGTRTLDWRTAKISKGKIVVQASRWAEGDAGCCPTQAIEVSFNISADLADNLTPKHYPILTETEGPAQTKPEKSLSPATKKGKK